MCKFPFYWSGVFFSLLARLYSKLNRTLVKMDCQTKHFHITNHIEIQKTLTWHAVDWPSYTVSCRTNPSSRIAELDRARWPTHLDYWQQQPSCVVSVVVCTSMNNGRKDRFSVGSTYIHWWWSLSGYGPPATFVFGHRPEWIRMREAWKK